jgi:hypothetical protein
MLGAVLGHRPTIKIGGDLRVDDRLPTTSRDGCGSRSLRS